MSPLRAKVFLSHGDWSLILVSRSPEAERFLVALWAGQEGTSVVQLGGKGSGASSSQLPVFLGEHRKGLIMMSKTTPLHRICSLSCASL